MSHRHYINEVRDEIQHVLPACEMVDLQTHELASPFIDESLFEKAKKVFKKALLRGVEALLGEKLYVVNNLRELAAMEPRTRAMLSRFIQKGYLKSWTIDVVTQVKSYIVGVTLEINSFPTKDGAMYRLIGATGCGTGYTMNDALIPALAELMERYASSVYDERTLVVGSEDTLRKKGAVSLEKFRFFTDAQRKSSPELVRNVFDSKTVLHWKEAMHINSKEKVLLPAQMVYGSLSYVKNNEPLFFETNSNGTAAHTNRTEAGVRALLEVLERDAFLWYWLKKIPPQKIKKETIESGEMRALIHNIERQSFKLDILCLRTEFGLPTIAAVISGSRNRSFVFAGASCEFSLTRALRKSLFEVARMAQFYKPESREEIEDAKTKYPFFTTFKERYAWWSMRENESKILPFLSGDEIDSVDIAYPFTQDELSPAVKYAYLKEALCAHNIDAYLVDLSSKETREVGLCVQKAIVPDLIPAYFKEYAKPLALKRLRSGEPLQTIPHPFL